MAEYIKREAADKALTISAANDKDKNRRIWDKAICVLHDLPAADVAPVVRCNECANFRQNPHGVCWCDEYGGAITPEDDCSRAVRKSELPAR